MSTLVLFEAQVKPGSWEKAAAKLAEDLPDTRSFAGCQRVDCYRASEPGSDRFVVVSRWDSAEDHARYLAWRAETGVIDDFGSLFQGDTVMRRFELMDS